MLSLAILALAPNLSFYPLYFAPAITLLAREYSPSTTHAIPVGPSVEASTGKSGGKGVNEPDVRVPSVPESAMPELVCFVKQHAAFFVISCGLFFGLQWLTVMSFDFVDSFYGTMLLFRELRPNIGLWWYFFVEMFDFFRPFFVGVFQLFLASFCLPITIRLQRIPLAALTTVSGAVLLFRPYPEIGDLGLHFTLLALCKPLFKLLRYPLPVTLGLLYASILAPTFYHLWIYLGSGNSNFFYAITLVYALSMTVSISDVLWAALRVDYDGGATPNLSQL
jgi:phosphatidylinositol glycan class U